MAKNNSKNKSVTIRFPYRLWNELVKPAIDRFPKGGLTKLVRHAIAECLPGTNDAIPPRLSAGATDTIKAISKQVRLKPNKEHARLEGLKKARQKAEMDVWSINDIILESLCRYLVNHRLEFGLTAAELAHTGYDPNQLAPSRAYQIKVPGELEALLLDELSSKGMAAIREEAMGKHLPMDIDAIEAVAKGVEIEVSITETEWRAAQGVRDVLREKAGSESEPRTRDVVSEAFRRYLLQVEADR